MMDSFRGKFQLEPDVNVRLIEPAQCDVTQFLRTLGATAAEKPHLTLARTSVPNGSPVSGTLETLGGLKSSLLLIDHKGMVFNLDERVVVEAGKATFSIPIGLGAADRAAGKPVPQIIVAVTGPSDIEAATFSNPTPAAVRASQNPRRDTRKGSGVFGDRQIFPAWRVAWTPMEPRRFRHPRRRPEASSEERAGFAHGCLHMVRRAGLFAAALTFLALLVPGQARAEFTVCNQTLDVVNLSVGQEIDSSFQTDGWWTVGANQCVNVIREELTNRYIYVYATDVFGHAILSGSTDMCVERRRFSIRGIDECWQRGHIAARFYEIDTLAQIRWTFFLTGRTP